MLGFLMSLKCMFLTKVMLSFLFRGLDVNIKFYFIETFYLIL